MSNTTTTDEGNKLIAEFDGKLIDFVSGRLVVSSDNGDSWYGSLYDKDWNTLMAVVEKIEKIANEFHGYFEVYISSNNCTIQGSRLITTKRNFHPAYFADHYGNTKIEATWLAVVNFIKWYNNQNK